MATISFIPSEATKFKFRSVHDFLETWLLGLVVGLARVRRA